MSVYRVVRVDGKWQVVFAIGNKIQSVWKDRQDAECVARDLNSFEAFEQSVRDSEKGRI